MYEVNYSGHVLDELRAMLVRNPGRAGQLVIALQEAHRRLQVYPQFGQPLRDLKAPLQLWVGVVYPLVFHYVLDDSHRRVMVMRLPLPLPRTGII